MTTEIEQKILGFCSKYPKRTYPKGQILVFADESPEGIFYMVTGRVREYDISYRGDEVIVNVYKPPSFFPMSWVVNRIPDGYFYKTEIQSELHVVPTDAVHDFVKANPDVMLDLLSRVYKGVDGLQGRLVQLMSGTAASRLKYEIVIECYRFGEKNAEGGYRLSTNEVDLAARSGLSRETVSREIAKLKESGLVSIIGKVIHVNNISALAATNATGKV